MSLKSINSLIRTAEQFRGVREKAGNRGIVPDFANWWLGRDMAQFPQGMLGAPWCSTSVNLWGRLAVGEAWPVPLGPKYSDVDAMVEWAQRNNVWHDEPDVGDLFCVRNRAGGYGHIGVVVKIDDGHFSTIEGNTNDDGSFNGNGVYERIRPTAQCGFIRWVELT